MWWWAPHQLLGKGNQLRATRLLVVDEEQRFGVAAERKKSRRWRKDVDVLNALGHRSAHRLYMSSPGLRGNEPDHQRRPALRRPIKTPHSPAVTNEAVRHRTSARTRQSGGQVGFYVVPR